MNKRKVFSFTESFDDDQVYGVQQILSHFGVCGELREYVEEVISDRQDQLRKRSESLAKQRQKKHDEFIRHGEQTEMMASETGKYPGEPAPLPVIGFCPKCGSIMGGSFVQPCETRRSSRVFLKECTACTYHSELFKKRGKYIEVEGG